VVANKAKHGKAAGPSGVVSSMLKASGEIGIECMTNVSYTVVRGDGKIQTVWKRSWWTGNVSKGMEKFKASNTSFTQVRITRTVSGIEY